MRLSTCFFQVLGDFFPSWGRQELLRESHPFSVPLCLPDQDGPCIFPTSSRNIFAHPALLLSLLSLSTPPGWTSGHVQSDTLQQGAPGQPCPAWVHIPGLSAAHTSSWVLVPRGFCLALAGPEPRAEEGSRCCRRALPGRCCSCNLTPHRRRSGRWGGRCPRPAGPRRNRRNKSPLGTFGASWGRPR